MKAATVPALALLILLAGCIRSDPDPASVPDEACGAATVPATAVEEVAISGERGLAIHGIEVPDVLASAIEAREARLAGRLDVTLEIREDLDPGAFRIETASDGHVAVTARSRQAAWPGLFRVLDLAASGAVPCLVEVGPPAVPVRAIDFYPQPGEERALLAERFAQGWNAIVAQNPGPGYGRADIRDLADSLGMRIYQGVLEGQWVEFQSRPEHGGDTVFPDWIGGTVKATLSRMGHGLAGAVAWEGQAGADDERWVEANTFAVARLLWDPRRRPRDVAMEWAGTRVRNRRERERLANLLCDSPALARAAFYPSSASGRVVSVVGRRLTGGQVTSAPLALALAYEMSGGHQGREVRMGAWAAERATIASRSARPPDRTLDYRADLFRTLAAYREASIRSFERAATGAGSGPDLPSVDAAVREFERRYGMPVPYDLSEVHRFVARERRLPVVRVAAGALAALLAGLALWLAFRPTQFLLAAMAALPCAAASMLVFFLVDPAPDSRLTGARLGIIGMLPTIVAAVAANLAYGRAGSPCRTSRLCPIAWTLAASAVLALIAWRGPGLVYLAVVRAAMGQPFWAAPAALAVAAWPALRYLEARMAGRSRGRAVLVAAAGPVAIAVAAALALALFYQPLKPLLAA